MKSRKKKLAEILVQRGYATTEEKARRMILAGEVTVKGVDRPKPGVLLPEDVEISVSQSAVDRYVGRGALKLEHALKSFQIDPMGCICLDVGASTGGFTECLLRHGAEKVYAVDAGYGQLHYRLRNDPRVVVMERVNARYPVDIPEPIDLATIDVSFISVKLVLPSIESHLRKAGEAIFLLKTQFEAKKRDVPAGGIIRDPDLHVRVIMHTLESLIKKGWKIYGLIPSPIKGAKGNREYLVRIGKESGGEIPEKNLEGKIRETVKKTFNHNADGNLNK